MRRLSAPLMFGFIDQAVSSLGSLGVLSLAARSLVPSQFGLFALSVAGQLIALSVARSLLGETMLVRESAVGKAPPGPVAAAALLFGLISLPLLLLPSLFAAGDLVFWLCTGLTVLPVLVFDSLRYVLLLERRGRALVGADVACAVFQCAGVVVCATRFHSATASVAGLGLGTFAAVLVTIPMVRLGRISFPHGVRRLRTSIQYGSAFAAESILGAAVGYITLLVIAKVASIQDVAAFRATVAIYGLTSLVINFLRASGLRELAGRSPERLRVGRAFLQLAILMIAVSFAAFLVLEELPKAAGAALFGKSWMLVTPLLFVGVLNRAAASLSVIPTLLLRVRGVTWKAAKARAFCAVLSLCLGPVGAALDGAKGALLADSLSYLIIFFVLTRILFNLGKVDSKPAAGLHRMPKAPRFRAVSTSPGRQAAHGVSGSAMPEALD